MRDQISTWDTNTDANTALLQGSIDVPHNSAKALDRGGVIRLFVVGGGGVFSQTGLTNARFVSQMAFDDPCTARRGYPRESHRGRREKDGRGGLGCRKSI